MAHHLLSLCLGAYARTFVFGLRCSRYRLPMSTSLCRMAPFLALPRVYHMLILAVPEKPSTSSNYPGIIRFVGELGNPTFQVLTDLTPLRPRTRLLVERHPYIRYMLFHIVQTLI